LGVFTRLEALMRSLFLIPLALIAFTGSARAWGNEGHEIVATVAASWLKSESPETLRKVNALLKRDTDDLTDHDIADEATWADVFRGSSNEAREKTQLWHFVDIDFDNPNIREACFGFPTSNDFASEGPPKDCVINKIDTFKAELADPDVPRKERLLALKFLLHFVGDVHQPLHAITRVDPDTGVDDRGGNCVGILRGNATVPVRLHSYWDTTLVQRSLGKDVDIASDTIFSMLTPSNVQRWAKGTAKDWAQESYDLAKKHAYKGVVDQTPDRTDHIFKDNHGKDDTKCGPSKVYAIDTENYDSQAMKVIDAQLAKAALRLARLLEDALQ
jgi:hypothetical protein